MVVIADKHPFMTMKKDIAEEILLKYKNGEANAEEQSQVERWLLYGADEELDLSEKELLDDLVSLRERMGFSKPKQRSPRSYVLWKGIAAAAAVLLTVALGIILYPKKVRYNEPQLATDKPAATNSARLALSNGTEIELDKVVGKIAKESGIEIINDQDGNLVYNLTGHGDIKHDPLAFNTIKTPRGGHYKLILPDGSKVWLNAESSLRFPVSFSGTTGRVELKGEGYFEVSKSRKKFEVATGNISVEVLGTHFNINAYDNAEQHTVSLLEGRVNVRQGKLNRILKPGEQALLTEVGHEINVRTDIDTEAVTAWKNGVFQFNNTELKDIMHELERWYDVDVNENNIPRKKFNGTISRDVKLSEVLAMIELTSNLHFKIEGRSIIMK